MGCVGIIKSILCLVGTYAMYMTFTTIYMIITSFSNKYQWITSIVCFVITVLSYRVYGGIHERRYLNRNVGIMDTTRVTIHKGQMIGSGTTNNNNIHHATNGTNIYPALPGHEIFSINGRAGYAPTPSAPPMPIEPQISNFSNF